MNDHRDACPSAVLWDMDGTLVDTEPFWIEAEHGLAAEHGADWDDAMAHSVVGRPLLHTADVLRAAGVRLEPEAIVHRLMDQVIDGIRGHAPWRPGAHELVEELAHRAVPMALVTMSWRPLVDAVLAHLPVGTFAVIVTGDEVRHGKPHPEPYLTALARLSLLGVDPQRAVAIEDSPTGLASAEAAGLACVGVPHVVPIPAASGRLVLPSLERIRPGDLDPVRWRSQDTVQAVSEP